MKINTNVESLIAQRIHAKSAVEFAKSNEKLATGIRINRGADDPAGLISSENLRSVLATIDAESKSLQRTDHVAATAEAALDEVSGLLSEANALAVANANSAGVSDAEREANQIQIDSIISTVDRIAGQTAFNGDKLLDGTAELEASGESVQIDSVQSAQLGNVEIDGEEYSLSDVGSGGSLNTVSGDLSEAQQTIQAALDQVNSLRGRLGSFQKNTIGSTLNSLAVAAENVAAAESEIRDTDYAQETANQARLDVLNQAALSSLAISNNKPNYALTLLG